MDIENAILASLLPTPSKHALLNDLPDACRGVLRNVTENDIALDGLDDEEELEIERLDLLQKAFKEVYEYVKGVPEKKFDRSRHTQVWQLLCELLEVPGIRTACTNLDLDSQELIDTLLLKREAGCQVQELWVAEYIFMSLSNLLADVPDGEYDSLMETLAIDYLHQLTLPHLRAADVHFVNQLCNCLRDDEKKWNVKSTAALVFMSSHVLQRKIQGIELIMELEVSCEWAARNKIITSLIGNGAPHPEVTKRLAPIVRTLAVEGALSREELGVIRKSSLELMVQVVGVIPSEEDLDWIVDNLESDAQMPKHDRGLLVELVHVVASRGDVESNILSKCIAHLWKFGDVSALTLSLRQHIGSPREDAIFSEMVTLCVDTLAESPSFFSHAVLAAIWQDLPELGHSLVVEYKLHNLWTASVGNVIAEWDRKKSRETLKLRDAFHLGSVLLANSDTQGEFLKKIWDVFAPYIEAFDSEKCDTFYAWVTSLCKSKTILSACASQIFWDRLAPFIQRHESTGNSGKVFNFQCFRMLRSLFVLMNEDMLEDLLERPLNDSGQDSDEEEETSKESLGKSFLYLVPKCPPSELQGITFLWSSAVHCTDESVAGRAIETLQALYDAELEPSHPHALRARRNFVETCTDMLEKLCKTKQRDQRAMLRCLGFVESLLNEADTYGTRGFRSHGARQRGGIHTITVVQDGFGDGVMQLVMYGNATVWDIRCSISARLEQFRCPANRISLLWRQSNDKVMLLETSRNSSTLSDLNFSSAESLYFTLTDDLSLLDRTARVRLLDMDGVHLSPLACKAVKSIFAEWATHDTVEDEQTCMSFEDFTNLFLFCTGATNTNAVERRARDVFQKFGSPSPSSGLDIVDYLVETDFIRFYEEAAQARPASMWKDLVKHGFDAKLQRNRAESRRVTSEFRFSVLGLNRESLDSEERDINQQPRSTVGWRPLLAEETRIFDLLFALLKEEDQPESTTIHATPGILASGAGRAHGDFDSALSEQISNCAWSILMRLPTSTEMLENIQSVETRTGLVMKLLNPSQSSPRLILYALHIVASFMEEDESTRILEEYKPQQTEHIEQHFERARRASFEIPAAGTKQPRERSEKGSGSNAQSNRSQKQSLWTERFLAAGGLEKLLGLLMVDIPLDKSLPNGPAVAFQLGETGARFQVLELSLKACKLLLTYSKLGSDPSLTVLTSLSEVQQEHLVDCARNFVEEFLHAQSGVTVAMAEYALFIWNFYYSWIFKENKTGNQIVALPECCNKLVNLHGIWKNAAETDKFTNEEAYARSLWKNSFTDTLLRICSRFDQLADSYLENLLVVVKGGNMDRWLAGILCSLLQMKISKDRSSVSWCDLVSRTIVVLVDEVISGQMNACQPLNILFRAKRDHLDVIKKGSFSLSDLVAQVSHKIVTYPMNQRSDMLELLGLICTEQPDFTARVAETVFMPLLRIWSTSIGNRNCSGMAERKNGKMGLVNLGNTCYLNSLLQQLSNIQPILRLALLARPEKLESQEEFDAVSDLQTLLSFLAFGGRKTLSPKALVDSLKVDVREQQDVEEYLNRILDMLERTCTQEQWKDLFGGTFKSVLNCVSCGHSAVSEEPCGTHVALDIEGMSSVEESLENGLLLPEKLDGFRCTSCGSTTTVTRTRSWGVIPSVSIFHLKRFRYNLDIDEKQKVTDMVRFEETLNGRQLVGIICHQGSADCGHYYSYIQDWESGVWFELNDSVSRVLDGFPLDAFDSAYLLCYVDKGKFGGVVKLQEVPKSLSAEVERDNALLETSLTLQQKQFWNAGVGILKKTFEDSNTSSQSISSSEGLRPTHRRRSVGLVPDVIEPSWWPKAAAAKPSDFAEDATVQLFKKLAKGFLGALLGLYLETDYDELTNVMQIISHACKLDADLLISCLSEVNAVTCLRSVEPRAFRLVAMILESCDDVDNQVAISKLLLEEEGFLECAMTSFSKCPSSRPQIASIIYHLLRFSFIASKTEESFNSVNTSRQVSQGVADTFDWVFSSNRKYIGKILEQLQKRTNISIEDFSRAAVQLSSLSCNCAEMVAATLTEMLIGGEGMLIGEPNGRRVFAAFEAILLMEDLFAEARLETVIGQTEENLESSSQTTKVANLLGMVLNEVSSQWKGDVNLVVLKSPSSSCILGRNHGEEVEQVLLKVSNRVSPAEREEIAFIDVVNDDGVCFEEEKLSFIINPGESLVLHLSCNREEEPTYSDTLQWETHKQEPIFRQRSEMDLQSVLFVDQDENSGNFFDNSTSFSQNQALPPPPPNSAGGKSNKGSIALQVKFLKSMGFDDEYSIKQALEIAKGDENVAVELLLNSSSAA